ncbi:hypothetical protein [Amycolatopsis japonica]
MTDEVTIIDRVQVEVENLNKLDSHAAIPAAEHIEAIYQSTKTSMTRRARVHGFTADLRALVLAPNGASLVPVRQGAGPDEKFLRLRTIDYATEPRGPFTPAPPGLFAVYGNGKRTPIVYYDIYGRPVVIDADDQSRQLTLALEDTDLAGIHGGPRGDTSASDNSDDD